MRTKEPLARCVPNAGDVICSCGMADEITLAETKPATEWIRGRPVPKVSPKRRHALVQKALLLSLDAWAAGRGEVGPEWRHRIAPGDEVRRRLVPDVAYTSFERLRCIGTKRS